MEEKDNFRWYEKNYKKIIILSLSLLLISIIYIGFFYYQNGEIIKRDISLTGGTSITVYDKVDASQLLEYLEGQLDEIDVTQLYDLATNEQKGLIIETRTEPEQAKSIIESYLGYNLDEENSSIEFTGSSLGEGFYNQLLNAIIAAFVLMGMVVFLLFGKERLSKIYSVFLSFFCVGLIFSNIPLIKYLVFFFIIPVMLISLFIQMSFKKTSRNWNILIFAGTLLFIIQLFYNLSVLIFPIIIFIFIFYLKYSIPSTAVMVSGFADIVMTLAVINLIGIEVSAAGIVGFLMLIGYSVDTDIMLTNRMLKRSGEQTYNVRLKEAFKTGMMMTLSSLIAVLVALIIVRSFSPVLTQIFTILSIGLVFDILNTWFTNASLLRWHAEKTGGILE